MNPLHLEQNNFKIERENNKSRESNVSIDSNRASFSRNSHHKRKESLIESAGARTSMSIIPSLLHSKDDKNEPLLGRFHRELKKIFFNQILFHYLWHRRC